MKRSIIYTSLSVLAASMIIGCGGGGGSSATLAKLDTKAVDDLGKSVASALPGCTYLSATASVLPDEENVLMSYQALFKNLGEKSEKIVRSEKYVIHRQPIFGDCGGDIQITGMHDNGDNDMTYTYNDYCVTDALGQKTTLNGTMHVFEDGTPTANGPVLDSTSYTTEAAGLATKIESNGETTTSVTHIDDLVVKEKSATAKEMKFVKGGKTYKLKGLVLDLENNGVKVKSGTFDDPDVGAVSIETTAIPLAGGKKAVTLTVKGADGTKAEFKTNDITGGAFEVTNNDGSVGTLTCPNLL